MHRIRKSDPSPRKDAVEKKQGEKVQDTVQRDIFIPVFFEGFHIFDDENIFRKNMAAERHDGEEKEKCLCQQCGDQTSGGEYCGNLKGGEPECPEYIPSRCR